MTLTVTTFIKCVNDKDEHTLWVVRKGSNEILKKSVPHRLWCQVCITTKVSCHNGPKWGEDFGKFVDKSWKDIPRLTHIRVVPPAEKPPSEVLFVMKVCTDQMSQCCFADSRQPKYPVCIDQILLPGSIGHPGFDMMQERFTGAFHTAECPVIASLDTFKLFKQYLLLYMNY